MPNAPRWLRDPSGLAPAGLNTQAHTVYLYLLNSSSNKIKLALWNPTFVLSDGGMKWDSINTLSPIGLAGWLPTEAALKRLGAAITQVELQRRWGWEGDDSALITASEKGVISCSSKRVNKRHKEGVRYGGGCARMCVNDLPCFLKRGVAFSKARQLEGDLFGCAWVTAAT